MDTYAVLYVTKTNKVFAMYSQMKPVQVPDKDMMYALYRGCVHSDLYVSVLCATCWTYLISLLPLH